MKMFLQLESYHFIKEATLLVVNKLVTLCVWTVCPAYCHDPFNLLVIHSLMELSPSSQESSTGPYPEPNQSKSYLRILSLYDPFNIVHPLRLGLPSGLFPSGFPISILYAFLFAPFMLHSLPISSSLALSFYLYLEKSTSYEAPHCAVFSWLFKHIKYLTIGNNLHKQINKYL
jgi:hypothetical protein